MNAIDLRIGHGWDRHALQVGRPCLLGGVLFAECPVGPVGHSDGDALVHALIDALLGAAALGDIGGHFSDGDPQWAGADSLDLLDRTWNLLQEKGFKFGNADCTIITERPMIAPATGEMKKKLGQVLGVEVNRISVKATRGEGLGPEGRGECVTAMATVLLSRGMLE